MSHIELRKSTATDKETDGGNSFVQKGNATNGAALVEIAGGTVNAIFEPDKETPTMLFRVKAGQSFTGASAGDPILAVLTINTVTNTLVSANPLWYNGNTKSQLNDADVDTAKLEAIASNSLTLSEFQTVFGNTSDSAATTDTENTSFIGLFKRSLQHLSSFISNQTNYSQTLKKLNSVTRINSTITASATSTAIELTEHTQQFFINVSAITASDTPKYTLKIKESFDGETWYSVYQVYRESALSFYTPRLAFKGRYVQFEETLEGTGVSVTRKIIQIESSAYAKQYFEYVNQSLDLNGTGGGNNIWQIAAFGTSKFQFLINASALSTAATVTFYGMINTKQVELGTLQITNATALFKFFVDNAYYDYIVAKVTTAGTGITLYRCRAILTE